MTQRMFLSFFLFGLVSGGPMRLTDLLHQQRGSTEQHCDDLLCGQCKVDCLGVPGGSAVEDKFGVCCKQRDLDCVGVCNGSAAIDVCGVCAGGTTYVVPGLSCEERPEGCTVWCIISIVLLSTATIGAFGSVACVCCLAAGAVDRPRTRKPEEYRYGGPPRINEDESWGNGDLGGIGGIGRKEEEGFGGLGDWGIGGLGERGLGERGLGERGVGEKGEGERGEYMYRNKRAKRRATLNEKKGRRRRVNRYR